MQNAKVAFRRKTLKQTGTAGKILMWMQDNEKFLRDTTLKNIYQSVAIYYGLPSSTVHQMMNKLVQNQMVIKSAGGRRRGRVYINYYHKDIPGYVLERAPQDTKDRVKAMKENLEKGQHISKEGCLVTTGKKTLHAPYSVIANRTNGGKEERQEDGADEPKDVKPDAVQPIAQEIEDNTPEKKEAVGSSVQEMLLPVIVKREQSGRNISLTININLNA